MSREDSQIDFAKENVILNVSLRPSLPPLSLSALLHGDDPRSSDGSKKGSPRTKKKLPTVPTQAEQQSMRNTIRQRSPTNAEHLAAYGPFFLEYSMLAEYNHLRKQRLPGVYVIPSCNNPLVWYGVVFIRIGMYQDGVFRFTMKIPTNYPDGDCPTIIFNPPIFHPVINPLTGDMDVKRAFHSWRPNVNHLWQVLMYARRIFYKIETNNPRNKDAANLYDSDKEAFREKVQKSIKELNEKLYSPVKGKEEDDPHVIRFKEWIPEVHDPIRQKIFGERKQSVVDKETLLGIVDDLNLSTLEEPKPKLSGLSFIEPGSTVIFSKEDNG